MKAGIRRGMNTLDNIHKAAKKEFLDKGFQMASLRNIVKNAGVTTGAFYGKVSGDCMEDMLDYMYANEDEFRLILLSSQGTRYENMVHEMSDIEVMATHDFVDTMKRNGKSIKSVDPMLEHMLVSGMFSAFFELLIHKDDIKEAKTYLKQLRAFYTAGWAKVFEMSLEG